MAIDIYNYQNYRHYLLELFEERKEAGTGISHREILRRMDITSTGFLSNVLAGRNNLTAPQATALAGVLELDAAATKFFETLVGFTQARTTAERTKQLERMARLTRARFKELRPEQLSLFAKWHYAVVRELLFCLDFDGTDYRALGRMLSPPVSAADAEEAVRELEKIGLVGRDAKGFYRQKKGIVSTGDEIRSAHVASFITETARKAEYAIDTTPPEERDCTVLTMKLSPELMKRMKTEIQGFRKKLLAMAEADEGQDSVYQCAISFFPVAKASRKETL